MSSRHASYWERRHGLEASPQAPLPADVDILIVGAGFMGRWLAWFLTRSVPAAHVLVIERDGFTYGASSRNAGFLTCGHVSEMHDDVKRAGLEEVVHTFLRRREGMAILRRELPELQIDMCGSVDYDEITEDKLALAEHLNERAAEKVYEVREIRLAAARRRVVFNRADGGLDPVQVLQQLQERTPAACFRFGVEAKHVGGGTAEVSSDGVRSQVRYGRAFICTNGFAQALHPDSSVVPGRGQVLVTSPVKAPPCTALGYVRKGYDYVRYVDGRLLVGGGRDLFADEQGACDLTPTQALREHLVETARRVLGHGDFEVAHHWAGVMGFPGGAHLGGSQHRRIDATTDLVAGFGGMGVALAPLVAQEIANTL